MKKEETNKTNSHDQEILAGLLEQRNDLKHFVFSSIPNWSDAEDVLQEACLKIWKNREQFEPGSNFRAWAFTVTRYTILDFRKRYATRRIAYLDIETVQMLADELVASEITKKDKNAYADALAACIALLGERLSRILKSHYKDGFSIADLAKRENASEPSIKQLLYRTRLKLKECIQRKLVTRT